MNAHRIVTEKGIERTIEINAHRVINDGKLLWRPESESEIKELEAICAKGKTAVCQAAWLDATRLKFTGLAGGGALVIRSQTDTDHGRLARLCPTDQSCAYRASWRGEEGLELVLVEDAGEKPANKSPIAQVSALSEPMARETAAELGVPWDDKASRQSMNKRIADAIANKQ